MPDLLTPHPLNIDADIDTDATNSVATETSSSERRKDLPERIVTSNTQTSTSGPGYSAFVRHCESPQAAPGSASVSAATAIEGDHLSIG
jgi:hypothetical protein